MRVDDLYRRALSDYEEVNKRLKQYFKVLLNVREGKNIVNVNVKAFETYTERITGH